MTLIEAAALLDMQPGTLRQQIHNGRLRATKVGRDWQVSRREVDRYRAQSRRPGELERFRAASPAEIAADQAAGHG
jgi:excisionase family DNA binding protein